MIRSESQITNHQFEQLYIQPSMQDQKLTCQVQEIVGRINGKFGTLTAVRIHHLDRALDFHALCALFANTGTSYSATSRISSSLAHCLHSLPYKERLKSVSKKLISAYSAFENIQIDVEIGHTAVTPTIA